LTTDPQGRSSQPKDFDDASHEQREWLRVTLSSIGDAVITTDTSGNVTFLNPVAESLIGWSLNEALGVPLDAVFKIVNEETRQTVENPATRALREGLVIGLANHTLLITKDGTERPIDDSAAPIRNRQGKIAGVVLVFRDISERRKAERAVQDALTYAENIIATLRHPFLVVLDKELRVVTANRSFYRTFHVAVDETENRLVYELGNHQWDIPALRNLLEDVLPKNDAFQDFEVEHDFPSIGRKIMLLNARRIERFNDGSEPTEQILLAIEDVTERRKAEQALRDSEERFRRLVEGAQDYAIFLLDPQGTIASWNAGAERIKGYRAEEIIGKHFSCFYPPEAIASGWPEEELRKATNEGRFEDEGWRLRKDGSQFWANVIITALRDESGKLIGFSKITRDLTERRQAETKLQESEIRYRRLFETAGDGVLLLDFNTGAITDANPFMCELLGYSHDELIGKELWEIGLFEDAEASRNAYRKLQEQGYIRYSNLPLETRQGKHAEVEFVSNVYPEDHKPVIQCNVRDNTEHRKLELAMMQAEAMADLNRRKDEFLAMLSHELRNPLAPIMNSVHLLRLEQGSENPIQQQARTIIERQVAQLSHLVDDLLEVSRIMSGRIRLQKETVDMRGVVERSLESVRPLIEQRKHKLTVSQTAEPIWLNADSTRIEQIVVNLLNNAAKYMQEGVQIWLITQRESDGAVLRVRDTGVGISPDLLPHIFDLFTQAERSLDRSQGGLGIGLTLVQRLVDIHGGRIEAHSTPGQGSEFIVRLPVAESPVGVTNSLPDETKTIERSFRVLVVDDNVDAADSAAMLLRRSGHDVRVAYSSQAALDAADSYRPHIILLDIGLPKMDGYEVARRLRKRPELRDVRLVAVTGYGQETDRQRSHAAGFDSHLVKPFTLEQVQHVLPTSSDETN
jgi:PAS domain S-box-containing protein